MLQHATACYGMACTVKALALSEGKCRTCYTRRTAAYYENSKTTASNAAKVLPSGFG